MKEILIAGFGGQGVLSMGKVLAYTALMMDKEVTWMPSYGPEQRGGTANVTVIISEERISSPIVETYDVVVVLNQPSLERFESAVKPGGILLYDPYGIATSPTRGDLRVYSIPAMRLAAEDGQAKAFNMIVLGGLLRVLGIDDLTFALQALKKTLPERHHNLIPLNERALKQGMEALSPASKTINDNK